MSTNRVAAFSDGVFAIIITIIVLGISFPSKYEASHILDFSWDLFIFIESGLMIGANWYVHSRLLDGLERISVIAGFLNVLYLLVLSVVPLFTKGIMENPDATFPALGFAVVIIITNIVYLCMESQIKNENAVVFSKGLSVFVFVATLIIGLISFFAPRIAVFLLIIFPIARWNILLKIHRKSKKN